MPSEQRGGRHRHRSRDAGGDGWELIQRLSSDPRTKEIPVVMLTACATEAVRSRAAREGLAAFFFKPCAPDVLAAELRRLCGLPSTTNVS